MTSSVKQMFGCCVSTNVKERLDFDDVIFDQKTEILHFIIPQKHYDEFVKMKPEDNEILNLRQYMFLYKFTRMFEMRKCPGKDYERVSYVFADRNVTYWLQGWIPTRPLPAPKPDDIDDMFYNLHTMRQYEKNVMASQKLSSYSYGNITNWSRHNTETFSTGDEYIPAALLPRQRLAIFSDENHNIFHKVPKYKSESPKDIVKLPENINEIQTTPVNKLNTGTVHRVGACVVTTSTFNTRDRRFRPKAAKGPRTRHY
ncbi:hypothetical protein ACF0H5_006943 [Mactra antiquata]